MALVLRLVERVLMLVQMSPLFTGIQRPDLCPSCLSLVCRSSQDAPEVANKIGKEYGVTAKAYQCDAGDEMSVSDTFATIDKEMGPVTGLVAVSAGRVVIAWRARINSMVTLECRCLCRKAGFGSHLGRLSQGVRCECTRRFQRCQSCGQVGSG